MGLLPRNSQALVNVIPCFTPDRRTIPDYLPFHTPCIIVVLIYLYVHFPLHRVLEHSCL